MPELRADADPNDALILVAFPSTGAASPIAAQYLIQRLDMPLVGDIRVEGMEALVHVVDGTPTSPVRIHGGDVACEVGGPCRRTYVVSCDIPLPPESILDVAETIMAWAKDARMVLTLDAITRDLDDDTPDVYFVATDATARERLAATGPAPLAQALMGGASAALLAAGRGRTAGALVVEARKDHPDGRAAAALIEALDPLIPQIAIDAAPLMEEAMALEQHILRSVADAEEAQSPRRPGHTFI